MTMARVKESVVVQVGLPDFLSETNVGRLYLMGWRQLAGKTKPLDGKRYEYGPPYSYSAEEDCVYATWNEVPESFFTEQKAEFIRSERDDLLKQSDWTQVADAPVDAQAWADYRQALRDVPQQSGFPADIDWPTKPE